MKELGKDNLEAKDVVEDAKNSDTPYHEHFQWNNKKAAEEYRLVEARHILRNIITIKIIGGEEKAVRTFHHVIIGESQGYVPEDIVFADEDLREQIITQALLEAKRWHERYKIYTELKDLVIAIERGLSKVKKK